MDFKRLICSIDSNRKNMSKDHSRSYSVLLARSTFMAVLYFSDASGWKWPMSYASTPNFRKVVVVPKCRGFVLCSHVVTLRNRECSRISSKITPMERVLCLHKGGASSIPLPDDQGSTDFEQLAMSKGESRASTNSDEEREIKFQNTKSSIFGMKSKEKKPKSVASFLNKPSEDVVDDRGDYVYKTKSNSNQNVHDHTNKTTSSRWYGNKNSGHSRNESDPSTARNTLLPKTSSSTTKCQIVREVLEETDFYRILGITENDKSSIKSTDIHKAYRRRALITHPDKVSGDRKAFDKVAEAYDVLSDENKKTIYDQYGKAGLDQNIFGNSGTGYGFSSAEDLFRSFFGRSDPFFNFGAGVTGENSRHHQRQQSRHRKKTVRYQLEVSLEDMYNGSTRTVQLQQQYDLFNPRSRTSARGFGDRRVEVEIPKGALDGQSIVISNVVDLTSNDSPLGDIVFVLTQRQHPIFTRNGCDLACLVVISLSEALCGFQRSIQHISGKIITVSSARVKSKDLGKNQRHKNDETKPTYLNVFTNMDESNREEDGINETHILIKTGDVQVLKGYGMPKDNIGETFGDLYLQFQVQMPDRTSGDKPTLSLLKLSERRKLQHLLQKLEGKVNQSTNFNVKKDVKRLQPASLSDFGRASGTSKAFYKNHGNGKHLNGDDESTTLSSFLSTFGNVPGTRHYYWSSSSHVPSKSTIDSSSFATDLFDMFSSFSPTASGDDR